MSLKLGLRNKIRRSRSAGAGFTGLLDQSFATGATAAYSLRRLKSSATKAVRVREDSGNSETDIGFSGGTLDETALLNHVGSNNGFVTKWYDQSGNGNDAFQSTASEQPKIVSGGTVIKLAGLPTIESSSSDFLDTGNNFNSLFQNSWAISYVVSLDDGTPSSNNYIFGARSSSANDRVDTRVTTSGELISSYKVDSSNTSEVTTSSVFSNGDTGKELITTLIDTSNDNHIIRLNKSQSASSNTGVSNYGSFDGVNLYLLDFNDGGSALGQGFVGNLSEIILYNYTSDNVDTVEKNQGNKYGI